MPQTNLRKAKQNADKIGVQIKPSKNKNKKLDVFKNNQFITSIGDIRYEDYLTHNDEKRKENYKKRFQNTRNIKNTASYYADKILWS
jgi:hypothetical protein